MIVRTHLRVIQWSTTITSTGIIKRGIKEISDDWRKERRVHTWSWCCFGLAWDCYVVLVWLLPESRWVWSISLPLSVHQKQRPNKRSKSKKGCFCIYKIVHDISIVFVIRLKHKLLFFFLLVKRTYEKYHLYLFYSRYMIERTENSLSFCYAIKL